MEIYSTEPHRSLEIKWVTDRIVMVIVVLYSRMVFDRLLELAVLVGQLEWVDGVERTGKV